MLLTRARRRGRPPFISSLFVCRKRFQKMLTMERSRFLLRNVLCFGHTNEQCSVKIKPVWQQKENGPTAAAVPQTVGNDVSGTDPSPSKGSGKDAGPGMESKADDETIMVSDADDEADNEGDDEDEDIQDEDKEEDKELASEDAEISDKEEGELNADEVTNSVLEGKQPDAPGEVSASPQVHVSINTSSPQSKTFGSSKDVQDPSLTELNDTYLKSRKGKSPINTSSSSPFGEATFSWTPSASRGRRGRIYKKSK